MKHQKLQRRIAAKGGSYALAVTAVVLAILIAGEYSCLGSSHGAHEAGHQLDQALLHHKQHKGRGQ